MKFRTAATSGWVTLVIGAVVGVAGCGGSGSPPQAEARPSTSVRKAAEATRQAGTSKVVTQVVAADGGKQRTMVSVGLFDYQKYLGRVQLKLPDGKGEQVAGIITPKTLYLQGGPVTASNRWKSFDLPSMGVGALVGGATADPVFSLDLLRGATDDVKRIGTEQVGGVTVTHYQGTIDLRHALQQAPPDSAVGVLGSALAELKDLKVPFNAYLDDQGRVRKVHQAISFRYTEPASEGVKTATITTATALSDFGTPVSVSVPKPSQLRR